MLPTIASIIKGPSDSKETQTPTPAPAPAVDNPISLQATATSIVNNLSSLSILDTAGASEAGTDREQKSTAEDKTEDSELATVEVGHCEAAEEVKCEEVQDEAAKGYDSNA